MFLKTGLDMNKNHTSSADNPQAAKLPSAQCAASDKDDFVTTYPVCTAVGMWEDNRSNLVKVKEGHD